MIGLTSHYPLTNDYQEGVQVAYGGMIVVSDTNIMVHYHITYHAKTILGTIDQPCAETFCS